MPKTVPLEEYCKFGARPRLNDPQAYIKYLRPQKRFKGCLLENLPPFAILLHDDRLLEHLTRIGYSTADYTEIQTGTTDPNLLYHVHAKDSYPPFILNRGLPGAGGAATQVAELVALGVRYVVHIGTCGLIGGQVAEGAIMLSRGAIKDGAAVMLSSTSCDKFEPVSKPSITLTKTLKAHLSGSQVPFVEGVGYTIPIFYMQPKGLIQALVDNTLFPSTYPPVDYFEMEQASVFELCRLLDAHAASMVVGSDRYTLKDGQLVHDFEDDFDQDATEVQMIAICLSAFSELARPPA